MGKTVPGKSVQLTFTEQFLNYTCTAKEAPCHVLGDRHLPRRPKGDRITTNQITTPLALPLPTFRSGYSSVGRNRNNLFGGLVLGLELGLFL